VVESLAPIYISSTDENARQMAMKSQYRLGLRGGRRGQVLLKCSVLGLNGIFIFTGIPAPKAPIELDADGIMRQLV